LIPKVLVWRLGGTLSKTFFVGVSICGYFICGLKTFNAHAPLKFFFYFPPSPPRPPLCDDLGEV